MIVIAHALLPVVVDVHRLQQEVLSLLESDWQPHFNTSHYSGSWDVLPLRSPGGRADNSFADLMGEDGYADTPLLEGQIYLRQLLDSMPVAKYAIRLLNLRSGASIKPHRDKELCFEKGEARLHIPVFTNPGVSFVLDDQSLKMEEGSCWYINANLTHSLQNSGVSDRIHLVIDCCVNDWLVALMKSSFTRKQTKQMAEDAAQVRLMIQELRRHDSPAAQELIRELSKSLPLADLSV